VQIARVSLSNGNVTGTVAIANLPLDAVIADSMLVVATAASVLAVDVSSCGVMWTAAAALQSPVQLLPQTDELLLVLSAGVLSSWYMDGRGPRWSSGLNATHVALRAAQGVLFAYNASEPHVSAFTVDAAGASLLWQVALPGPVSRVVLSDDALAFVCSGNGSTGNPTLLSLLSATSGGIVHRATMHADTSCTSMALSSYGVVVSIGWRVYGYNTTLGMRWSLWFGSAGVVPALPVLDGDGVFYTAVGGNLVEALPLTRGDLDAAYTYHVYSTLPSAVAVPRIVPVPGGVLALVLGNDGTYKLTALWAPLQAPQRHTHWHPSGGAIAGIVIGVVVVVGIIAAAMVVARRHRSDAMATAARALSADGEYRKL
jgi:hypothetical protein